MDVHGRTILFLDTEEVDGSNPFGPTIIFPSIYAGFPHISLRREMTRKCPSSKLPTNRRCTDFGAERVSRMVFRLCSGDEV